MVNRKAYYKAHYYHSVRLIANACLLLMSTLCHAQSSFPPAYQ